MIRPAVGLCPVCGKEFEYKIRAQGGGRRRIYCSAACRSLDWVRGHGASRKATVIKYEAVPENREKKRVRAYKRALRVKYDLTPEDIQQMLTRQGGCCAGCLTPLVQDTARVDHDHVTKRVRGLLCDSCNWLLGHAKDDPMRLRRLMAYLSVDLAHPVVYVIGALKNERIPHVGNLLRQHGVQAIDEWWTPGKDADTNWQRYESIRGRDYREALRGIAATNIYMFDRAYLDLSQAVVMVAPAGKSGMLELGYAKGRGKRTILFLDGTDPERYDVMPRFVDAVCKTEGELLNELYCQR